MSAQKRVRTALALLEKAVSKNKKDVSTMRLLAEATNNLLEYETKASHKYLTALKDTLATTLAHFHASSPTASLKLAATMIAFLYPTRMLNPSKGEQMMHETGSSIKTDASWLWGLVLKDGIIKSLESFTDTERFNPTSFSANIYPALGEMIRSEKWTSVSQAVQCNTYMLLVDTSANDTASRALLRDSSILGGARMGELLAASYDSAITELLIELLARMKPGKSGEAGFINSVFFQPVLIKSIGEEPARLISEAFRSARPHTLSTTTMRIMTRISETHVDRPQPFMLDTITANGVEFTLKPAEDRLWVDNSAFRVNVTDKEGMVETIDVLFHTIDDFRPTESDDGTVNVQIMLNSPPLHQSVAIPLSKGKNVFSVEFMLAKVEWDRLVGVLIRRNQREKLPAGKNKTPQRPVKLSLSAGTNLAWGNSSSKGSESAGRRELSEKRAKMSRYAESVGPSPADYEPAIEVQLDLPASLPPTPSSQNQPQDLALPAPKGSNPTTQDSNSNGRPQDLRLAKRNIQKANQATSISQDLLATTFKTSKATTAASPKPKVTSAQGRIKSVAPSYEPVIHSPSVRSPPSSLRTPGSQYKPKGNVTFSEPSDEMIFGGSSDLSSPPSPGPERKVPTHHSKTPTKRPIPVSDTDSSSESDEEPPKTRLTASARSTIAPVSVRPRRYQIPPSPPSQFHDHDVSSKESHVNQPSEPTPKRRRILIDDDEEEEDNNNGPTSNVLQLDLSSTKTTQAGPKSPTRAYPVRTPAKVIKYGRTSRKTIGESIDMEVESCEEIQSETVIQKKKAPISASPNTELSENIVSDTIHTKSKAPEAPSAIAPPANPDPSDDNTYVTVTKLAKFSAAPRTRNAFSNRRDTSDGPQSVAAPKVGSEATQNDGGHPINGIEEVNHAQQDVVNRTSLAPKRITRLRASVTAPVVDDVEVPQAHKTPMKTVKKQDVIAIEYSPEKLVQNEVAGLGKSNKAPWETRAFRKSLDKNAGLAKDTSAQEIITADEDLDEGLHLSDLIDIAMLEQNDIDEGEDAINGKDEDVVMEEIEDYDELIASPIIQKRSAFKRPPPPAARSPSPPAAPAAPPPRKVHPRTLANVLETIKMNPATSSPIPESLSITKRYESLPKVVYSAPAPAVSHSTSTSKPLARQGLAGRTDSNADAKAKAQQATVATTSKVKAILDQTRHVASSQQVLVEATPERQAASRHKLREEFREIPTARAKETIQDRNDTFIHEDDRTRVANETDVNLKTKADRTLPRLPIVPPKKQVPPRVLKAAPPAEDWSVAITKVLNDINLAVVDSIGRKFEAVEQHALITRNNILDRAQTDLKESYSVWADVYDGFVDVEEQYVEVGSRVKDGFAQLAKQNASISTALRQVIAEHEETSLVKKMPKILFGKKSIGPTFAALGVYRAER